MTVADTDAVLEAAMDGFLTVLRAGWTSTRALAELLETDPEAFLSDWSQANWETLVEAALSGGGRLFIEPYGDGADCNPVGSRIWMPGVASTHAVCCVARSGASVRDQITGTETDLPPPGLLIDRFATATPGGWYAEQPPFDHVLAAMSGREVLLRLSDVRFTLRELEER